MLERHGFSYARVVLHNGTVSLKHIQHGTDMLDTVENNFSGYRSYRCLYSGGNVLTRSGMVYDITGRVTRTVPSMTNCFSISLSGCYSSSQRSMNRTRIYAPATGDAWEFTMPTNTESCDVTDDGRFVMLYRYGRPNSPIHNLLRSLPSLQSRLPIAPNSSIDIYERPGKLRATYRFNNWDWQRYCLSPDGHAVAVYTLDGKCVLYRW